MVGIKLDINPSLDETTGEVTFKVIVYKMEPGVGWTEVGDATYSSDSFAPASLTALLDALVPENAIS